MSIAAANLEIEVAYGTPTAQRIVAIEVPRGTTAREAVTQSGIAAEFPEIDLESAVLGIFSRKLDGKRTPAPEDYELKPRDRIEIYRPLGMTPKEARRLRANRG